MGLANFGCGLITFDPLPVWVGHQGYSLYISRYAHAYHFVSRLINEIYNTRPLTNIAYNHNFLKIIEFQIKSPSFSPFMGICIWVGCPHWHSTQLRVCFGFRTTFLNL